MARAWRALSDGAVKTDEQSPGEKDWLNIRQSLYQTVETGQGKGRGKGSQALAAQCAPSQPAPPATAAPCAINCCATCQPSCSACAKRLQSACAWACSKRPSGMPQAARSNKAAPAQVACAARGTAQLPPRAWLTARSAATCSQLGVCASGASTGSKSSRSVQISIASAPR